MMEARYGGRCAICDIYFSAGADIKRYYSKYAHSRCVDKQEHIMYLLSELRQIMLADYGAALGLDIDPRVKHTFDTPDGYLTFAHKADIIDDVQLRELQSYFGARLHRSVDD